MVREVKEEGKIVSSCVCVIIPNLTHGQQPYVFIENVMTDEAYRKKGLETKRLHYAKEIAVKKSVLRLCCKLVPRRIKPYNSIEMRAIIEKIRQRLYNSQFHNLSYLLNKLFCIFHAIIFFIDCYFSR